MLGSVMVFEPDDCRYAGFGIGRVVGCDCDHSGDRPHAKAHQNERPQNCEDGETDRRQNDNYRNHTLLVSGPLAQLMLSACP